MKRPARTLRISSRRPEPVGKLNLSWPSLPPFLTALKWRPHLTTPGLIHGPRARAATHNTPKKPAQRAFPPAKYPIWGVSAQCLEGPSVERTCCSVAHGEPRPTTHLQ